MSFALHISENRLVIRAKQTREHDEDVLELIPHTVLTQDIPTLLVEGHAHWLNLRTRCLEFRPLASLWTSSPANWRLHFTARSKMIFGGSSELLIDTHSPTFEMLSQRLQPLESPKFLLIRYAKNPDRLSVQLPRLGLSFTLNSGGDLESQNIPRMVVDTNQSSGTLFGLRSQLILRETGSDLPSRSRCVIIPQGKVHFALEGNHPVVTIDTKGSNRVVYHQYKINTDLRYLEGNVSLASKLFKIYLHAVCSHCLPDPLTGRTGTTEALRELRSAGCISFQTRVFCARTSGCARVVARGRGRGAYGGCLVRLVPCFALALTLVSVIMLMRTSHRRTGRGSTHTCVPLSLPFFRRPIVTHHDPTPIPLPQSVYFVGGFGEYVFSPSSPLLVLPAPAWACRRQPLTD